jgi:hypothetical protein
VGSSWICHLVDSTGRMVTSRSSHGELKIRVDSKSTSARSSPTAQVDALAAVLSFNIDFDLMMGYMYIIS